METLPLGSSSSTDGTRMSRSLDIPTRDATHPCPIQSLPDDLLREIFTTCVFDEDGRHEVSSLLTLCAVDWHWRLTAIKHCILWTKIPAIELKEFDRARVVKAYNCLHLYLDRSGPLPVDFSVHIPHAFMHVCPPIRVLMELLLDHCSHWGRADLFLPYTTCQALEMIKGRLPELTSLKVAFKTEALDSDPPTNLDMFAQAPKLRNVDCATQCRRPTYHENLDRQGFSVEFPTDGLEHLSISELKDSGVYQGLLEAPPQALKTLKITVYQGLHLPHHPSPVPFPHLTTLTLKADNYHGLASSHLSSLTLPSLQELTIRSTQTTLGAWSSPLIVSPDAILQLLRRSGCSLRQLSAPLPPGNLDELKEILACSPDLESLDIDMPDEAVAEALVFDAGASSPVLPKLKALRFRCPSDFADEMPDVSSIEALIKVIKSRSFDLGSEGPKQTLEKVEFTDWYDESTLFYWIVLRAPMQEFIGELSELARQEEYPAAFWKLAKTYSNYYLHEPRFWLNWILWGKMVGVHKYLRRLERLDLERFDTHALTFYGVVRLIHELGKMDLGDTPGDHLGRFRTRARHLEEKWKPYLLRDSRKFWWVHHGTGLSLHWPVSANSNQTEDELYDSIIGVKSKHSFSDAD